MAEIILLDGGIATWELNSEGALLGTYKGTFKFRCFLTPTARIAAGREYRELLGANPTLVDEHESFLAYALTQLKYRIVSAPPFWSSTTQNSLYSGDIPEDNIITEILDAAVESEVKYREVMKKKKEGAIEASKQAASILTDIHNEIIHPDQNGPNLEK